MSTLVTACSPTDRDFGTGGAGGEGSAQSSSSASSSGGGCAAPMVDCGGKCVDPSMDQENCGTCGNTCPMGTSCSNSACACPGGLLLCGNTCLDGSMDPTNCGACGHDCLGGGCVGSMCQPITLAKGQSNPQDVAVGKAGVFWTAKGSAQVMRLQAGITTVVASGQTNASWIDVDDTGVYWTTFSAPNGTIMKLALGGGNPVPVPLFSNALAPDDIAVNNADVYWADYDGVGKGTLSKMPKTGAVGPKVRLSGSYHIRGIALDADNVYFTNAIVGDLSVSKIPLDDMNNNKTKLIGGLNLPLGIAVDQNNVYWAELNSHLVRSVPISGGSATTLSADPKSDPHSVAVDATYVYWTDTATGTVMKVLKDGKGAPIMLATGQGFAQGITQDATALYWVSSSFGTVMKLAK